MILRALEGDISSSDCLKNDKCGKENTCVTRIIFEDIEKSINNIIDNTTLQDMVQKRNEFPKEARQ
jgi:DNA-binding IscR family transcriptional regulator